MAHSDWLDEKVVLPQPCPAPMTRAALLALRASNALRTECPYIITDHVQGRLVAGTTITMRAVAANELSEQVEVNTTYDNEAWAGIYDLDRALVLELTDNLGNVAKGINGVEVANFDWGNTAYTGCRVENATWTVTYGSTAQMLRVSVYGGATLNTTGFTGLMQDNRIHTAATVNFSGANGTWRYNEWWGGGSFNASGYTGGGDNYYNEFNLPGVNLSGLTGTATFRVNEIVAGSITATGPNAFSIQNSTLQSQSINRPATGGVFNVSHLSSTESGNISHTGAGSLAMTGTANNGQVALSGSGALTANYCSLGQTSSISNAGIGALSMSRTTLQGASSSVTVDAGSNKAVTVNDCTLRSSGLIRVVGAVAGGAFSVTGSVVESGSFVYHRNTGALNVVQSNLQGSSGIDAQIGDRSYSIAQANLRAVGRMVLTGTGAATDSINEIMAERGSFTISCSGPSNSISSSQVIGRFGALALGGTTGAQVITRLKIFDATVNFLNCTANVSASSIFAQDGGNIIFNGVSTVGRSFSFMKCSNSANIMINNSSSSGSTTRVSVADNGSYNQSGSAVSANAVDVSSGSFSHNGGTLNNAFKRMSGILTTGNFNHTNIIHMTSTSRTLTASNIGRAEYIGLAPTAYTATGILI